MEGMFSVTNRLDPNGELMTAFLRFCKDNDLSIAERVEAAENLYVAALVSGARCDPNVSIAERISGMALKAGLGAVILDKGR